MILDSYGKPIRAKSSAGGLDWAFDSAKRSNYRGWFWFPSLDPAQQITSMSRTETARKINWAYNNIGAVRAVIDGLALDEVDTGIWPKPATSSLAFNTKVKALWQQQCEFHKAFSADGENNFFSAQFMIRREIRLRGDCFAQKLRSGEGASCPQMHFLPAWQCDNAYDAPVDQAKWRDGRMDNSFGRALQWRFSTGSDFLSLGDYRRWLDLSADDVIHFHDPFLIGQKRGISALAPVARQLFSMDDLERTETSGVLLRSRLAYAIERTDDTDTAPSLLPGADSMEVIEQPDGSKLFVQKIVSRDGTEVDVADMPAGKKLRVIESTKSAETVDWLRQMLASVAYCTLYPPDYIFSLAGLSQGTQVRLAQGKVQRVFNTVRDFQIIAQVVEEWWPFWLWQNIKAGALDDVRGGIPDEWWRYQVVKPRDITVDVGREGRLYDERVSTGKMPVGLYVGMLYGEDSEEWDARIIREHARRIKMVQQISEEEGVELAVNDIFRLPPGSDASVSTTDPTQPLPDNNPDDPQPEKKT